MALVIGIDVGGTFTDAFVADEAGRVAGTKTPQAGYVWINGSSWHYWGLPFGGVKSSGVGREESVDELLSYTQTKAVTVVLEGSPR